ncbi:CHASE2 domain-containing protein [Pseudorhodoferax sp. Leaf267]|uniref:CHASE2 domain-containing protein n=1 Tax=Pseudorhodoferax sp. Leaf267 TaxID=1736316 RepID=UPI0006FE4752|nr:CHASE2 domain-containing protein [Pseudorhodoferax sp. Leaf267]KQP22135.1 hypothetical protein ASF43_25235 [Pseudorhodoferax sp. Leaf267]
MNVLAAVTHLAHRFHDFIHHFVVALTVASVVGLLHHSGVLDWLDAAMLRIAGAYNSGGGQAPAADATSPKVLLIGGPLYERVFDQRSPLDRTKVASVVAAIAQQPGGLPTTLVLDLDLSTTGSDAAGQEKLDAKLKALVEDGVRLVLPLPSVAFTPQAAGTKAQWMRQACEWRSTQPKFDGRVVFASPVLRSTGGRVLQYSASDLSLGIAATRPNTLDDVCQRSDAELKLLVQLATGEATRDLTAAAPRFPKIRPLNAAFFTGLQQHVHELTSVAALPSAADGKPLLLAGRVVFVGGSYDVRDRFGTALELDGQPTEGVTLHAAVYYSAIHPVTVEQGIGALGLDIALGILMGYLFTAAWGRHAAIHRGGSWKGYLLPRAVYLAIVLGAFGLAVVLVWASAGILLPRNLWVSPGPVVIGVCAKLMLSRGAHAHGGGAPHASRWLGRAVVAALVLANIAMIIAHSL